MKVGILSAGGDCPGINAAIRGVGKTAIVQYGMEVIGISNGFSGLIDMDYELLTEDKLSGILTLGGTILGTSRMKPFKPQEGDTVEDKPQVIKENYHKMGLDALVCIGGNGTQRTANLLSKEGLNIVGLPKTIDNDVWGTDVTFGFDSAVNIATDAIDRLHTTANSHKRVMVIEVMGHNAGWIALHSGVAGGGDIVLLPEIEYDMDVITNALLRRSERGKPYSIVVVGEGIKVPKKKSAARFIGKQIQERTGLETRETILGYTQRGGTPSPADRVLATRYGSYAAKMIKDKNFGSMVCVKNNQINSVALEEVGGKTKLIEPNNRLVMKARNMGVCFGDKL
ncbi:MULTISPECIES: 6-phosphofructokinase [unclassified Saccharicrinis]|uniref:6-phosphofructokinase n=1 Tax=unclassified Saccharicrinis TaxID=2646859 RepID=UPI003D32D4F5